MLGGGWQTGRGKRGSGRGKARNIEVDWVGLGGERGECRRWEAAGKVEKVREIK